MKYLILCFGVFSAFFAWSGCEVFSEDNIWNTKIKDLPVHPKSSVWLSKIGKGVQVHPDFGSGLYKEAPIGIPVNYVDKNTPTYTVKFRYKSESDIGQYPIPNDYKIEGGREGKGDRHIISLDKDSCKLFELFYAKQRSNGQWIADSGAIFDLTSNRLRPKGWTSADAAGLPIYPGLVRYSEVSAGQINHALRFTLRVTAQHFIWPATHFASREPNKDLPPMGMRLRLKSNVDISGFSEQARVIAQALKEYGMMLADNGGPLFITGEPNEKWDNDGLRDLKSLTTKDFEAVDVSQLVVSESSGTTDFEAYLEEKKGHQPRQPSKNVVSYNNKAKYITQFIVSPDGDDANDGSYSSPWRTLQHSARLAQPGDTINVEPGVYSPFTITKSGNASAPITFYADKAMIDAYEGNHRFGISVVNAQNVSIKGFSIKYGKNAGVYLKDCQNINLAWNRISDNRQYGVLIDNCPGASTTNNDIAEHKQAKVFVRD